MALVLVDGDSAQLHGGLQDAVEVRQGRPGAGEEEVGRRRQGGSGEARFGGRVGAVLRGLEVTLENGPRAKAAHL